MQVSDVRVKLINVPAERLKAVCTVTFDGEFVVRDVKVVDGTNGLFVAMPSRKLSVHCPACKHKNHLRARFCNECGGKVPAARSQADDNGRSRLHRDIAHPITVEFRELVQSRVIEAFRAELDRAAQPGYEPAPLDQEHEHEPAHEQAMEPQEPAGEVSEYDAMIASLRGGDPEPTLGRVDGGHDRSRDRAPMPERGNVRSDRGRERGNQRREQGDRGRRGDGSRPRDGGRSDGRRNAPAGRSEDTRRRTESAESKPPVRREPAARPEARPAAGEGLERRPTGSPSVPSQPARQAPKPRPAPVATPPVDDEGGFGEGIL